MAFKFRFETLLKVRGIREESALQEFSSAHRQYLTLNDMKDKAVHLRENMHNELMARMKRGIHAADVEGYDNYIKYIGQTIMRLEEKINASKKQIDFKRDELLKAQRECKAVKRLREVDKEKYEEMQNKLEMKFIDEIAVTRHGRAR